MAKQYLLVEMPDDFLREGDLEGIAVIPCKKGFRCIVETTTVHVIEGQHKFVERQADGGDSTFPEVTFSGGLRHLMKCPPMTLSEAIAVTKEGLRLIEMQSMINHFRNVMGGTPTPKVILPGR
jgi:hypothetical protein